MTTIEQIDPEDSPFHQGEQDIQQRLGVREQMEAFGRRVIRPYLPQQHRDFYQQLPYLLLGSLDEEGRPWASILCGAPGFVSSPNDRSLKVSAVPVHGDPLASNLAVGSPIGLLGIELSSRRRNRLSAVVRGSNGEGVELGVVQSFGNCPQYIQAREFSLLEKHCAGPVTTTDTLTAQQLAMVEASDTFFVASASGSAADAGMASSHGVDVSHRGGRPGFVKVDEQGRLWIPDYPGNNHFNTLGNFQEYPQAGLLFPDFATGDLLSLTGSVSVHWDSDEAGYFDGAERFWSFQPQQCLLLKGALPIRADSVEPSANTPLTGTWLEAEHKRQLENRQNQWVGAKVARIVDEGGDIRSFYLAPELPVKPDSAAGQFLPVRALVAGKSLLRTYTLSSASADSLYRISVKRDGTFSRFLHSELRVGDRLEMKSPAGDFVLDQHSERPVLLVGAGVGITPMMAMARHLVSELLRLRKMRRVTVLAVARSESDRAFVGELADLERRAGGRLRVYWCLTQPGGGSLLADGSLPADGSQPGSDYSFSGRPNEAVYEQLLSGDSGEVYLCGPGPFMQDSYRLLRDIGVPDRDIRAEAFGPAGLLRDDEAETDGEVAESAVVSFVDSSGTLLLEQAWTKESGDLLAFAESHGLTPEFSCRSGRCGSCRATRVDGDVVHTAGVGPVSGDDVLLCSARPKSGEGRALPRVQIQLTGDDLEQHKRP